MTAHEEGQLDISRMHVQVLRSTFCLMVLAVAILVIFSSVALLRNPKNAPIVNVMFDMASGVDDQSARMRRGANDETYHAHAPVRRDILFEGGSPPTKHSKLRHEKGNILHRTKSAYNIHRNETKSRDYTKHKLDKSGNHTKHRLDKSGNHTKHRLDKSGNPAEHRLDEKKHYRLNSTEITTAAQEHVHVNNRTKTEPENTKYGIHIRTDKKKDDPFQKTLRVKDENTNVSNSIHSRRPKLKQ